MMFSKHLAGLPLPQAAAAVKQIGIRAIDLTVRPGGHIDPLQVEDQLPAAVQLLATHGVGVGMISTDITDAHDPVAQRVLQVAAHLGIHFYKLGYFRYGGFGTLARQRREISARLQALAALNLELGLHAGFHNHSDDFFGASPWDIAAVVADTDPRAIGVYFDPAHATIEGASHGWLMAMDHLQDRITMLAVKDFRWVDGKHRYAGTRRHSTEFCPLALGDTQWPSVLKILRRIGFNGPISFHGEYQGPHSFADLTTLQVVEQTAADLAVFQAWIAQL
jgi:sugar phosphate isomerase/epimerase